MPFSVSSAPSMLTGALLLVKVCWRKLAGTEDSPKHPEESTEDRPARRLQVDNSVEASCEDAPDKFGFGARVDGVQEWKTQEECK